MARMISSQGMGQFRYPSNAPTKFFSTNFPSAENPISGNGRLITSTSPGVNWSGLALGGGGNLPVAPVQVVGAGKAESVDFANTAFGDALAVLLGGSGGDGGWPPNQAVTIKAGSFAATATGFSEYEIHFRTDPRTGAGYEVTWGYNHHYHLITIWLANGGFTTLLNNTVSEVIQPGDILSASMIGTTITMYTNGVQVEQITDSTIAIGNPGFGFNQGGTDEYCIASFTAVGL